MAACGAAFLVLFVTSAAAYKYFRWDRSFIQTTLSCVHILIKEIIKIETLKNNFRLNVHVIVFAIL